MNSKDAYIEHPENTIKDLQNQVSNLTEIVQILRKEKFGSSSEKTPKDQLEGQLSLFNEAEIEADDSTAEPITKDVKGYKRKDPKTNVRNSSKIFQYVKYPVHFLMKTSTVADVGRNLKSLEHR